MNKLTLKKKKTYINWVVQMNPTVGDVAGNLKLAREARADAARHGADLVLFTELFIAGYPPEDLVLKPAFVAACRKAVEELAGDTADPALWIQAAAERHTSADTARMSQRLMDDFRKSALGSIALELPV